MRLLRIPGFYPINRWAWDMRTARGEDWPDRSPVALIRWRARLLWSHRRFLR